MAQRTSPGLDGSNGGRQSATQSLYNCKRFTGDTESDDEEEGWCDTMPCPRQEGRLSALGMYREPLRSACLCFPHLELMFLLFAFEGAVASQAWAIGDGYEENPVLFCLALAALLLFPVLMTLVIVRAIYLRVCPNEYIIFCNSGGVGINHDAASIGSMRTFFSRLRRSWSVDRKLFAWADKGQWKTDQAQSLQARQEGDRFRKGFEPVFVDFTKFGTLFVVLFLVERAAFASIAMLMDDNTLQLLLFCGIHVAMFFMLVCLEPFANRVINTIAAYLVAMDAISTGLMTGSIGSCTRTAETDTIDAAVAILQLVVLCVLIVPVYLDAAIIMRAICRSTREKRSKARLDHSQIKAEEQEEDEYIRSYTRRRWFSTWCTILRLNASACATDMREGLRRPHSLTAARSGPPPSSEMGGLSGEGRTPNELGVDGVDADNAATVVLADKLITVGAKARTWGGIATPGRRLPLNNGGIITANSFKRPGSTEAVPSGRGVMQQGENASTRKLASPIDASADHFAVFSRRYRGTVDRDMPNLAPSSIVPTNSVKVKYANSGREMIQRGQDSSWRLGNTWTMPSASKLFGSNQRDNRGTENDSPPTDSPVLLVSKRIGRTLQSSKNGTELADAIHALESSSCDEAPSPRLAASFKIGGDSPEWGADDRRRVARSLCSGGPELANSGRFSVDQSSNQLLQHQDDGKLPQYQIKNPAPQRVLRSSNDPESSVPPTMMTEHSRACASRPNREKAGAPPDALLAADELVNALIKDDLLARNNLLRQGVILGSGTTSVCSSGKSQAPDHGLNCKASDVGTLDSCTVQASLQKGIEACASTRGALVGMDRPLLPRGNRCPVEIDFPRRLDHQASQVGGSDSSRVKGGTKEGTNYSPVPKSTRCPIEVDFPRRLDRKASLVDKGRVEGSTKGGMDAPALSMSITGGTDASVLPRGNRCSIEVDFPRGLNTIPFEQLGSGAGSDGRTDSSRSHGFDDEIWNGPRAALRGITAVFQNSADSSFPRRKSFSSAVWEPPADADDEELGSTLSESFVEPKSPEQDASLLYLNCINWRAWDDMATINASWKNTPFALDQPRRGSQRRPSREGSKGTAASSSWRSYRSTEHNTLIENKVSSGDGEAPAVKEQQGLHRDIRNQHSARASVSVLAKLVSHKRGGPVQSDIPRRKSSEISVRNGAAVVAMDDNCDDGKAPNIHQLKDKDGAISLAPAKEDSTSKFERGRGCPRLQGRAPASGGVELNGRGGECPGVQSRTSVAVSLDISDRSSGRPEIQGRTPVTTGLGGSSHPISGGNSAGMHGGQMVQCQRCQEDAAIAQDEAGPVDGVVRVTIPAQQGSRRDPGTDGGEGGGGGGNAGREGVPVSPVELKPRSPEYADNKGRGVGLLTQYSDGFSDGGDELHGEEEGKVAAW